MLIIECPNCHKVLQIPEESIGKKGRCSFCQWLFVIQAPTPPQPQYPPPSEFYPQPQYPPPPQFYPNPVQTIEKTSKSWKGALAIGCFAWLIFLVVLLAGASTGDSQTTQVGIIGFVACAVWTGIVKVMIWWHHG
jgi:hypothetical protein